MASQKLVRTDYIHPTTGQPRSGAAARGESLVDMDQYYRLLEQVHASALHEFGVGLGFRVNGAVGQVDLSVLPGIALDAEGRHISLAQGGQAEVGPNADQPSTSPTLVTVAAGGATLPTAGLPSGQPHYVAVRFWETFDEASYEPLATDPVVQRLHTPWLKLHPVAGFQDDGRWIVLATVTVDGTARVTALSPDGRRGVGLPAERLELRRGASAGTAAKPFATDVASGDLRARPNGGVELTVPQASDEVSMGRRTDTTLSAAVTLPSATIQVASTAGFTTSGTLTIRNQTVNYTSRTTTTFTGCSGGTGSFGAGTEVVQRSPFSKLSVAADRIAAVRADGRETVALDSALGNITVGTQGTEGDVLVYDANGRLMITLDGAQPMIVVGGVENAGDVRVKDAGQANTVTLAGATGTAGVRRLASTAQDNVINVDAGFLRIHGIDLCLDGRSGGNKRALVDWFNNELHVNFANDYSGGVRIGGLHLADHIRTGYWEAIGDWNPGRNQWWDLVSLNTQLKSSEWDYVTMCEVGMLDGGSVHNFWWITRNASYVDNTGNLIVRWRINYNDGGNDWIPWSRSVFWLAFRR
jgi:hypothetical protein